MNPKNDFIREYLGVDAWHKAGYTGKRGLTLTAEKIPGNDHAKKTLAVFREIAPDREVRFQQYYDTPTQAQIFIDGITESGADTMYMSLSNSGNRSKAGMEILKEGWPECFSFFVCAGNDGGSSYNAIMEHDTIYGVGAVELRWSAMFGDGTPMPGAKMLIIPAEYTSEDDDVDFAAPTNLYLKNGVRFSGTSCATPVLCGMAALVNDFFIDKTGKPLPHEAMYRFLREHSEDVSDKGKDKYSGYGLPRLPAPDTIDVWAWQTKEPEKAEQQEETNMGNFKIALGAGHGINSAGKRCMKALDPNETREWWLNDRVCDYISEYLKDYEGYELMRTDDSDDGQDNIELSVRADAANKWGADVYISIHHNAGINGGSGGGIVAFSHPDGPAASHALRDELYEALIDYTGLKGNRYDGTLTADFQILRETDMPAVLLELGFMDSATDVPLILTNEFAQGCARAVVDVLVKNGNLKERQGAKSDGAEIEVADKNGSIYRVQLGAFGVKENAEKLAAELKEKGYQVYITRA